jgi:hypothetical protein
MYGASVYLLVALIAAALAALPLHAGFHRSYGASSHAFAGSAAVSHALQDIPPFEEARLKYPTCWWCGLALPPSHFQLIKCAPHAARLNVPSVGGISSADAFGIFRPPKAG